MKKKLEKIKLEIEKLENLRPDKKVNSVFSHLVKLATSFEEKQVELKSFFQDAAAKAEVEMEKFWAKKIIESANPQKTLREFWYYQNYLDLTKLEFGSLSLCHDHKKHNNVLFVGSGPLPLTGIFLARDHGCTVAFLDINKDSLKLSEDLCAKLGITNVHFVCADAISYSDYGKFDTIIIAAMIESKKISKEKFINLLSKKVKKHTHILVRSVFHNRELLYKKLDVTKITGLQPILEVRPKNQIVNSFHVFEK